MYTSGFDLKSSPVVIVVAEIRISLFFNCLWCSGIWLSRVYIWSLILTVSFINASFSNKH